MWLITNALCNFFSRKNPHRGSNQSISTTDYISIYIEVHSKSPAHRMHMIYVYNKSTLFYVITGLLLPRLIKRKHCWQVFPIIGRLNLVNGVVWSSTKFMTDVRDGRAIGKTQICATAGHDFNSNINDISRRLLDAIGIWLKSDDTIRKKSKDTVKLLNGRHG